MEIKVIKINCKIPLDGSLTEKIQHKKDLQ